jgi:hypothetical protein
MPEPQSAASRARRSSRPPTSPACDGSDQQLLPAAPLLQAVQQHAWLRRQSLRELLDPDLFGACGNAHTSGTISLVILERLCDEVLGWHPGMPYGEAYDQATLPGPWTTSQLTASRVDAVASSLCRANAVRVQLGLPADLGLW